MAGKWGYKEAKFYTTDFQNIIVLICRQNPGLNICCIRFNIYATGFSTEIQFL